ncbi:hypothetical protein BDV97DRAFT_389791 [Delphinella strobiligena]|nr:hypothetical protein BDV97DRAFT_389791 [Delphinella strobiligena]
MGALVAAFLVYGNYPTTIDCGMLVYDLFVYTGASPVNSDWLGLEMLFDTDKMCRNNNIRVRGVTLIPKLYEILCLGFCGTLEDTLGPACIQVWLFASQAMILASYI